MWETDKVAQNTSYSRCRWFNKLLNHVLSFSQDWMTVLYQENVFKYSKLVCLLLGHKNKWGCVCTYLTGLSYTGCGHCSELCGLRSEGEKRTKWSEEEWKELREVVGLPTETAFIHVKPTDSWFLWRQHNTDKARMLATEIKMIKRRLWIKHGGIKEEISR